MVTGFTGRLSCSTFLRLDEVGDFGTRFLSFDRATFGIDRDPEQYFKWANSKYPERGGAKKVRFGETPTERKAYLTEQRSRWAELQNAYLEKHQHDDRVDARSYQTQGID